MDCLCPNCKAKSELIKIGEVEYIHCQKCGWFESQADGSMSACEPPSSETKQLLSASPSLNPGEPIGGGPNGLPPPPLPPPVPPGDEDDEDEDEDNLNVRIRFED
jgi:Zn ribbon nucleic-acid-binding protein